MKRSLSVFKNETWYLKWNMKLKMKHETKNETLNPYVSFLEYVDNQ